jgi:glycosyltransferase involved in cell wall biosynthesis
LGELRVALVLATSTGGVGRHVADVARELSSHGVRAVVLGPRATNERFGFATPFRSIEIGSAMRLPDLVRTALAAVRLRRVVRGADVVHAHGFRAAAVSVVASRRVSARRRPRPALVVTFHNAMSGGRFRRGVLLRAMRLVARRADTVFVVSPDLAAAIANSRRALVAAPSGVADREPATTRRLLDIADDAAIVLAVGRLHPQKGFDVLVRAATRWPPDRRVVVVIAGDGPQRDALSKLIAELAVDVRLMGDRDDIADLLQVADVVAMPSRWEGWPLTAGEVLTAGRPMVAAAVGGLPELVGDAAVLVPPADPVALADAITTLLEDAELAGDYARRAVKRAAELPVNADVVRQLVDCYARLASRS